jgi:integrase
MSIRKRRWTTRKGDVREAWVVGYTDSNGKRRLQTFSRKKAAEEYAARASIQVREGTHVADSVSVTVAKAGEFWIAGAEAAELERTTIDQYNQHLKLHIIPFLGHMLLSRLTAPIVRNFEDTLRDAGRSAAMIKRARGSLGALLADAQERGLVARNVVRDLRGRRRRGKERQAERRHKAKLVVGVDIPTRAEIKAIIEAAKGRWRPLFIADIFTGLRASELRGLRWPDVELANRQIQVRQRVDRYNKLGSPKSDAGRRTIPIPRMVVNVLREWKLACPKGDDDLVFPNGAGKAESLTNIIHRGLIPTLIAAGVTKPVIDDAGNAVLDKDGKPQVTAKYTGMHALRHFYASWLINRPADGGLGLQPKSVQERLGHSSIVMTMDVYGHLFPRADDSAELDAAERALLA